MHEHTPYGHRTWIIGLLLGESTIDRSYDVAHNGKHFVGRVPKLDPIPPEYAAALPLRGLLQPAARHVRAKLSFDARYFVRAEPLRPHQCTLALLEDLCRLPVAGNTALEERFAIVVQAARVLPAQSRDTMPPALVFHRNHEVAEVGVGRQDNPADIFFVESLHHDHQGRSLRIVEARRADLFPPCESREPLGL